MTIQDVSKVSGLSIDVLRVWERRYRALQPQRLANNRRNYTQADLERAVHLRACVRAGHSISTLAGLDEDGLSGLLAQTTPQNDEAMIAALLAHVHENDGAALFAQLRQAMDGRTAPEFCDRIVSPLLREVGEYWLVDDALIAKEHLASSVVTRLLGSQAPVEGMDARRPLIFSTIPSERHTIGTAMAAFVAERQGFPVYVTAGSTTPAELGALAKYLRARGVGLSVIYSDAEHTVRAAVDELGGIPVWVGGANAPDGPWKRVESMTQFAAILSEL